MRCCRNRQDDRTGRRLRVSGAERCGEHQRHSGANTTGDGVEAHDWVLATRTDGRALGIGERGPLWLVFDPLGERPATKDESSMWPWAVFLIQGE